MKKQLSSSRIICTMRGATIKFSVYDRRHSLSILALVPLYNTIIYNHTKEGNVIIQLSVVGYTWKISIFGSLGALFKWKKKCLHDRSRTVLANPVVCGVTEVIQVLQTQAKQINLLRRNTQNLFTNKCVYFINYIMSLGPILYNSQLYTCRLICISQYMYMHICTFRNYLALLYLNNNLKLNKHLKIYQNTYFI